ncbi:hypothetical protein BJ912DRAFT_995297, partial [Pholiota molesta]
MSGARGCFNCGGFGHQAANCPKAGTPTWVLRDTSLAIAAPPLRPSLATSAARRVTSPATALMLVPLLQEDSPAELAQSATSAERWATSLAPAPTLPPVLEEATAPSVVETRRLATPAVVSATCRATAFKARSAITAPVSATSAATAPNPRSALATPAALKGTSRATAPELAPPTVLP